MCMFSRAVFEVSDTSIFARGIVGGGQYLAYQMRFAAATDTAMVLPLPVIPGSGESAVVFINLDEYPSFFADMARGFPMPTRTLDAQPAAAGTVTTLQVHEVGDYEASYVPTHDDWPRLDRRFRLSDTVWDSLPEYGDFGFAVFKLKGSKRRWFSRKPKPRSRKVHPMAFTFPRREPDRLFYPTVHVHDGRLESHAHFDHALYCQSDSILEDRLERAWVKSAGPASTFMDMERSEGLVAPDLYCYRWRIRGTAPNEDVWVAG